MGVSGASFLVSAGPWPQKDARPHSAAVRMDSGGMGIVEGAGQKTGRSTTLHAPKGPLDLAQPLIGRTKAHGPSNRKDVPQGPAGLAPGCARAFKGLLDLPDRLGGRGPFRVTPDGKGTRETLSLARGLGPVGRSGADSGDEHLGRSMGWHAGWFGGRYFWGPAEARGSRAKACRDSADVGPPRSNGRADRT